MDFLDPPVAERRAHTFSHHGIEVEDPYFWLKDQSYPNVGDADVLAYLRAENEYFNAYMAPLKEHEEALTKELFDRLEKNDWSVPYKDGEWVYQRRFYGDEDYPVHVRWSITEEQPNMDDVQNLIDERKFSEEFEFFDLGSYTVSNDGYLMTYSTDTTGAERYQIRVKDLRSEELLPDVIEDARTAVVWAKDNRSFFYLKSDEQWRPYQVKQHMLGTDPSDDALVYEEHDPSFFCSIARSTSREFLIISTGDHETSEVRVMPLEGHPDQLALMSERTKSHEYSVDHQSGRFVIVSNRTHKNFAIETVPEESPQIEHWETLLEGSDDRYIQDFLSFENFIATSAMEDGLRQVFLIGRDNSIRYISFPEPTYSANLAANAEIELSRLRISYSSLVTPTTVYDYDVETDELLTRKVQKIPSGYDKEIYTSERLMVPSRDGVQIPVSLVYRKDLRNANGNPLYLYGYGAYGSGMQPSFSTTRISLLDRGFIYAIAHIRGGDELGHRWEDGGKLMQRTNTFNDFVDVAQHLVKANYTNEGRIAIAGGSAGGSLMGAVTNTNPELWGAVSSHVPFVDILNTMLDATLPLTPIEWPEWGNPIEDKNAFEYIRSYSPYDQLEAKDYPPILVTAGLNDPRVTYWEPAKYVAKLRYLKTDDNPLLLKTEMGAGHSGKTGRSNRMEEIAEEYSFIFKVMQIPFDLID